MHEPHEDEAGDAAVIDRAGGDVVSLPAIIDEVPVAERQRRGQVRQIDRVGDAPRLAAVSLQRKERHGGEAVVVEAVGVERDEVGLPVQRTEREPDALAGQRGLGPGLRQGIDIDDLERMVEDADEGGLDVQVHAEVRRRRRSLRDREIAVLEITESAPIEAHVRETRSLSVLELTDGTNAADDTVRLGGDLDEHLADQAGGAAERGADAEVPAAPDLGRRGTSGLCQDRGPHAQDCKPTLHDASMTAETMPLLHTFAGSGQRSGVRAGSPQQNAVAEHPGLGRLPRAPA